MEVVGKLDVFVLDGDVFGVDSVQVGVFKEGDEVRFDGFLESINGGRLEVEVGFEVLGNFVNEMLEGEFVDEKFS